MISPIVSYFRVCDRVKYRGVLSKTREIQGRHLQSFLLYTYTPPDRRFGNIIANNPEENGEFRTGKHAGVMDESMC